MSRPQRARLEALQGRVRVLVEARDGLAVLLAEQSRRVAEAENRLAEVEAPLAVLIADNRLLERQIRHEHWVLSARSVLLWLYLFLGGFGFFVLGPFALWLSDGLTGFGWLYLWGSLGWPAAAIYSRTRRINPGWSPK
jgi:hypothetical protein